MAGAVGGQVASPPAPLQHLERGVGRRGGPHPSPLPRGEGEWPLQGQFSVGGCRRGAGGVLAEAARGRGGARPRVGRNLDGRMHLVDGGMSADSLTPGPSPTFGEGWIGAFAEGAIGEAGLEMAPL